jgi:DNA gyrase subunit A
MPTNEPLNPNDPAMQRLAILDALVTAIERRAELIEIVASAENADQARSQLATAFDLNEIQATAALDLQVRRFATRERQRINDERNEIRAELGLQ